MDEKEIRGTRRFWNSVAADWRIQVGDDGDPNRRLNSDPVLWALAGEIEGRTVLDAGCGVGYLSNQLHQKGARVVGVDFSEKMIAIARKHYPEIDFRVDSCSDLRTVPDGSLDLLVSNYVLMDTPDLEGTVAAFHRVLRPDGSAILVFSHPCFPGAAGTVHGALPHISYRWDHSYFERTRRVDPPWHHFKEEFIWFHRPLSDYWKAFRGTGFTVVDFEEPRVTEDRYHLAPTPKKLESCKYRPYSVAFKLEKASASS